MNLNEYQGQARSFAKYPRDAAVVYPTLGLVGEAGEVAEKIKKLIRDENGIEGMTEAKKLEIAKELGDVLWYLANLSHDLGFTLAQVAVMNINKLTDRNTRGVISGSGDNR